jgi:predicted  nucleic acid-binding Zn-ribbon protein
LEEEVKEYQLFRVTKLDQELIMGGGKNRNQLEVNSLTNGLQHSQKTHVVRLKSATATLSKLKQKVRRKRQENQKIDEEILQMQLALKERKRIYSIHMKSSEGVAEARKSRLKQVMMISRLKRARHVQETNIQDLRAEVARLRKCVYASFNDGEEFEPMSGYNS